MNRGAKHERSSPGYGCASRETTLSHIKEISRMDIDREFWNWWDGLTDYEKELEIGR